MTNATSPAQMEFERELSAAVNRASRENNSNTPDFILAQFMAAALQAFENASRAREHWYGSELRPALAPSETVPTSRERIEQIHQAFDEWLKKADPHNLFATSHGFAREAWQDAKLNAAPQAGGEQSSSSAPDSAQSPAVAALREVILAWEQNLEDEAAFDMAHRDLTRSHDQELERANESFERLRLAVKAAKESFL